MGPNFDYYCILCALAHRIICLVNIKKNKFFDLILALSTIALYVLVSDKLVLQTTLILCEVTHGFVWLFQHKKKLSLSILTLSFYICVSKPPSFVEILMHTNLWTHVSPHGLLDFSKQKPIHPIIFVMKVYQLRTIFHANKLKS